MDRLTFHWPDRTTETISGLPADRVILVREGIGIVA